MYRSYRPKKYLVIISSKEGAGCSGRIGRSNCCCFCKLTRKLAIRLTVYEVCGTHTAQHTDSKFSSPFPHFFPALSGVIRRNLCHRPNFPPGIFGIRFNTPQRAQMSPPASGSAPEAGTAAAEGSNSSSGRSTPSNSSNAGPMSLSARLQVGKRISDMRDDSGDFRSGFLETFRC